MLNSFNVVGYTFVLGSYACPEQYEGDWKDTQVAYVRLRHGMLRVEVPDVCGETILYTEDVEGDGCFTMTERPRQLRRIAEYIENYYINNPHNTLAQYELNFI